MVIYQSRLFCMRLPNKEPQIRAHSNDIVRTVQYSVVLSTKIASQHTEQVYVSLFVVSFILSKTRA